VHRHAFHDRLVALERRIELFACLPIEALDRLALEQRLREIGRTEDRGLSTG
jgi:hypothetical protein